MLIPRRFSLCIALLVPLCFLSNSSASIFWEGPDAPTGSAIDWAEDFFDGAQADPGYAGRSWYGQSHTRSVGLVRAGESGELEVPKFVKPSPEARLEAVILTIIGESVGGWHILHNETGAMGLDVSATLGATINIDSNTSLSKLSIAKNVEENNIDVTLTPNVGAGGIPDPAVDPAAFIYYLEHDEPDDEKLVVTMDPPISFEGTDANSNAAVLGEWKAQGGSNGTEVVVLDWSTGATATATHTTNNVETAVNPPSLEFQANVSYVWTAPEPFTMAFLGLGALPLLARRYRRRAKK